ncbi:MAG: translation initiation factor IF-2 [Saprospiraceae bacterium]|nr:translation initiation factor IF-2 [Saprospiraceae bacterium]
MPGGLLIKVAKELNVGLHTIVDHLQKKGFSIEEKATAKVTEEMYNELIKEFQASILEKSQADAILQKQVASANNKEKEKEKEKPKIEVNLFDTPAKEATQKKKEEPVEAPKEVLKAKVKEEDKPKLKVVGKINLKDQAAEEQKVEVANESKDEPANEEVKEELTRIEAPTLKGLKILGKIDTEKFKEAPKKEENKQAQRSGTNNRSGRPSTDRNPNPNTNQQSGDAAKRKRKRKAVTASDIKDLPSRSNRGGHQRTDEEVKVVSQKEVEDKIKATMARLQIGGKNKRQKIRRDKRDEMREKAESAESHENKDVIQLSEFVTVSEIASLMDIPVTDVIMTCMNVGIIVSINQRLDAEVIEVLAEEFNKKIEFVSVEEELDAEEVIEDDPKDLLPRAPIVTVMGHVDHGKTSLLDYIRNANVVSGEAGGITQHIGAYEVSLANGKKITFLDTPGHEAFTAMRARGAKLTDVAIIIIAADDKIMPQTKEAISHAQAANVPMVFAINKVDKPGADAERIKSELSQMNLLVDSWGGKYSSQEISAKTGMGVDELLEKIQLEAEILELKANPNREASGTIIEASLDKGRGYITKILVQNGSLSIGDVILAGEYNGKVKAMFNERGQKLHNAGPSVPVMVLGLTGAPSAGEKFKVMEEESEARLIATKKAQIAREQAARANKRISLDEIGRRLALGNFKELRLIVKGDVDGSVEALADSLIKLSVDKIKISVIHKAVGQIIESDVLLASASDAIIIGFQVRPSGSARQLAEREGVEIKTYSIIYEAIEEVKLAMEGMLEPTKEEKILGSLEIREVFKVSKVGTIAGCMVTEGKVTRNSLVRVIRDGIVVYPTKEGASGELASLKRFKDDAKEVTKNMECGVNVKNFNDIKVGDIIEAYEMTEVKQKLA